METLMPGRIANLKAVTVAAAFLAALPAAFAQYWHPTSAPNRDWLSVASSADGNNLVAVGATPGIYTSTDSGFTWQSNAVTAAFSGAAASADGTKMVVVGYHGIYFS